MAINKERKIILFCVVGYLCLFNFHMAFSQGREFQRTRPEYSTEVEAFSSSNDRVSEEYSIAINDTIEVFVWQNPDLTRDVIVDPDGYISPPLVGRVRAVGLTLVQLEKELTDAFAQYIKHPKVSLMIKKFSGHKLIVLGEVNYPGIYVYNGAMDIVTAVALAGDFTEKAHKDSVIVVRRTDDQKPQAIKINVTRVITKGSFGKEFLLKPNDIVFVPKTFIANLNKFIADIGPAIGIADTSLDLRTRIKNIR